MGHRVIAQQPRRLLAMREVAKSQYVRVFSSDELIEDDDYAPGVMDDMKAAWDDDDYFDVELYDAGRDEVLESMFGMAGYGGPEAASCNALLDYWAGSFSPAVVDDFIQRSGCVQPGQQEPPPRDPTGYDIDLSGPPPHTYGPSGLFRPDLIDPKLLYSPSSERGDTPLTIEQIEGAYNAGYEAASWAHKRGKSTDRDDMFLWAIKYSPTLVPNVREGDPSFWEWVFWVGWGAAAYVRSQGSAGSAPAAAPVDMSPGYDINLDGLGAPVVLATQPRTLRLTYKLVPGHHASAIRVFDSEDLIFSPEYTTRTQAAMKAAWDAGDHYDVELYDPVTGELFEVVYNQAGYGSPAAAACAVMRLHWAPHELEDPETGEMFEGGFVWPEGVIEKFYADMGCRVGSDCPPGVPEEYRNYNLNGLQVLGASGGPSNSDIAEFSSGFFEALLWSSTGDDENPLDANYEVGDIDKLARDALERECAAFARRWSTEIQNGLGYDRAGHDFALTRNQHGAGFWDGDWPVDGDVLTPGAQDYPSVDLYVGDDGKLYVSGYELGAHFNYNGPREVEVLLPDATYIGPFGSDALAYEAYRKAAVVDDVGWKPGTFVPADNSAGYDIDLDGLGGLGAAIRRDAVVFKLFDNGGITADRYTLICAEPCETGVDFGFDEPLDTYPYAGFDDSPSMPNGIGTTGEITAAQFEAHERTNFHAFGRPVELWWLPPRARDFANTFMTDVAEWCHQKTRGSTVESADAADDSAGYDIDLNGLGDAGGVPTAADLERFTYGFFIGLVASRTADGFKFPRDYVVADIAEICLEPLTRECEAFARRWATEIERGSGYADAGHGFFYARDHQRESFEGYFGDSDALIAGSQVYTQLEDVYLGDDDKLYVSGYEMGVLINISGAGNGTHVFAMLPDAAWIGPYANIHLAHAAYHAAVNPQDARAQRADDSAGYDIDLNGPRRR